MDLADTLSGMPGAGALPGLADAWHWSPNPRFHFAAALSADRAHVLQVNTLDSYDEDLVRTLLAFTREHSAQILADPRAVIPLPGFTFPGREFDTAAVAAPRAHQYHARENSRLHEATYAVFPAWHYEFSGTETDTEASFRVSHPQGLRPTRLDRSADPFLKMRYKNTKTQSESTGAERGFAKPDTLYRELALLQGADGSFMEFENHRHQIWCAEWVDAFVLAGEGDRRTLDRDELMAFAAASLT